MGLITTGARSVSVGLVDSGDWDVRWLPARGGNARARSVLTPGGRAPSVAFELDLAVGLENGPGNVKEEVVVKVAVGHVGKSGREPLDERYQLI